MTYLAWAALFEGSSDLAYFAVLLPRLMNEIISVDGTRPVIVPETPAIVFGRGGRTIEAVAAEACAARDAFHLLFIHADTGGRNHEETLPDRAGAYCRAIHRACGWKQERCVLVCPRHETEAWAIADPEAVAGALGYRGPPTDLELPPDGDSAERLVDPKLVLETASARIRRQRGRGGTLLPAIAQLQSFGQLRRSRSFRSFEASLRRGLVDLGMIR